MTRKQHKLRDGWVFVLPVALCLFGCGEPGVDGLPPDGTDPSVTPPGALCDLVEPPVGDAARCPVTLRYRPPALKNPKTIAVAGEWNGWSPTAQPLSGPDASGDYQVTMELAPGTYAYKVVLDGNDWRLDEGNPYRRYDGGIENSGLRVADCHKPALRLVPGSLRKSRPEAGVGEFSARIELVPPRGLPAGACQVLGTLRRPETSKQTGQALPPLGNRELLLFADRAAVEVRLSGLPDGKYTVAVTATAHGRKSETLLLPFWIEAEEFSYSDTPLYMAVTDRFSDGEPKNNRPLASVEDAANYHGGDLQGVKKKIDEGYFDRLGVRALWLTPFYTQPEGSYIDQSGQHQVAPFHGYWPVKARAVDPRLGGDEALHALVEAAHRRGMRVLMDAVLNHVHDQHEYFQDPQRRSWFRTGCTCGTSGCDWTEKRLSCLFSPYMPDIDWTVSAASEQFIADTLWWLEEFDLDGLRIDAVKHVEDLAIQNLGTRVRERFEQAGTRYYLLGETAMGWNDGSIASNRENYDTIKRYMGPHGLDGQFDFVWYHGIAYRVFAYDEKRFLHVDYWTHASLDQFQGSLMVNYLGSHDTSRFISQATYRDASGPFRRGIVDNKWKDLPSPPLDQEPYDRAYLGLATLFTIPGVPLLYYGDEYGEYGGSDPDCRHDLRETGRQTPREQAQLTRLAALLKARSASRGLRRGPLQTVLLEEDVYAFARTDSDPRQGALVLLNRLPTAQSRTVRVPGELRWPGVGMARLREALSGNELMLDGGAVSVTIPARGALILSLK